MSAASPTFAERLEALETRSNENEQRIAKLYFLVNDLRRDVEELLGDEEDDE